jgi:UDP-N-acetylmuramate-alanine ligase
MEFRGTILVRRSLSEGGQGAFSKVSIYDDYAHHPTEIRATLRAFREKFPKAEIVCVFQPHQAKRLAALFKEFKNAFDDADSTLILPLYKVPGRDEEKTIYNSEKLVRAIQKRRPKRLVFYLDDPKKLKAALKMLFASRNAKDYCCLLHPKKFKTEIRSKDKRNSQTILVMMGAGNIVQYTDELLKAKFS